MLPSILSYSRVGSVALQHHYRDCYDVLRGLFNFPSATAFGGVKMMAFIRIDVGVTGSG